MDKLSHIFELQEGLNSRCGVVCENFTDEDKVKWILNFSRALQQECSELIDSTPWKWWAKYQAFDQQNAKVEIVDMLHFLVSLAQTMGMSADDLYNMYCQKNKINHTRQDSGYVVKDKNDCRNL